MPTSGASMAVHRGEFQIHPASTALLDRISLGLGQAMLFQLCQVRRPGIAPLVAREGWGAPVAIPAATCSRATRALARAPYLVRIRAQSGDALSLRRHHA